MDRRAKLFITSAGRIEADHRRSSLDFKSRSILTSLGNKEKSADELLDKIFIENKEALHLLQALIEAGFVSVGAPQEDAHQRDLENSDSTTAIKAAALSPSRVDVERTELSRVEISKPRPPAGDAGGMVDELPAIPALSDADTIDVMASERAPVSMGALRPVLELLVPTILRRRGDDDSRTVPSSPSDSITTGPESSYKSESISTTRGGKSNPLPEPVPGNGRANRVTPPSLIRPAVGPNTPGRSSNGLLTNNAAGDQFLNSFGKNSGPNPTARVGTGERRRTASGKANLPPDADMLRMKRATPLSQALFLLLDYCIDHLGLAAAGRVEELEVARDDRQAMQSIVYDIARQLKPSEREKRSALHATVRKINELSN